MTKHEERFWQTKKGDRIAYPNLDNTHLLNILKYIKRRAKEGVTIYISSGYCDDDDFETGEVETLYGKDVMNKLDYAGIYAEAKKRKLIKQTKCQKPNQQKKKLKK